MLRSMFAAISGLRNHQTMMDVVGNNIANVNTTGFKSSATVFEDVLSQQLGGAGQPSTNTGGTNPSVIGLGSRVAILRATILSDLARILVTASRFMARETAS